MTIKGTVHGPYYGCHYHYCREEQCWPPEDLNWSEKVQGWVCINCWNDADECCDEDAHGERGESLAEALRREWNKEE